MDNIEDKKITKKEYKYNRFISEEKTSKQNRK